MGSFSATFRYTLKTRTTMPHGANGQRSIKTELPGYVLLEQWIRRWKVSWYVTRADVICLCSDVVNFGKKRSYEVQRHSEMLNTGLCLIIDDVKIFGGLDDYTSPNFERLWLVVAWTRYLLVVVIEIAVHNLL